MDAVAMVAHQGGWDEILLVAGPMVVIAGLLVLAKRRVDASVHDSPPSTSADSTQADSER